MFIPFIMHLAYLHDHIYILQAALRYAGVKLEGLPKGATWASKTPRGWEVPVEGRMVCTYVYPDVEMASDGGPNAGAAAMQNFWSHRKIRVPPEMRERMGGFSSVSMVPTS